MTQVDTVYQADENSQSDRRAFLRALYGSSPDDLYLELRCIHPITEEVRTLWGRTGNKRELASRLRQAGALNREGFGVYFAPCLRREKKGNAEAAVWVPALWIDIDGGEQQRERNLEKLRSFEPAPSFIIDSGGGWHGYWLLDEPFQLNDEADRQKIAAILRGLFSALGGDPSYVKSVASVMRLPGSVNTKPERGGVVVSIVESSPGAALSAQRVRLAGKPTSSRTDRRAEGDHAERKRTASAAAAHRAVSRLRRAGGSAQQRTVRCRLPASRCRIQP